MHRPDGRPWGGSSRWSPGSNPFITAPLTLPSRDQQTRPADQYASLFTINSALPPSGVKMQLRKVSFVTLEKEENVQCHVDKQNLFVDEFSSQLHAEVLYA